MELKYPPEGRLDRLLSFFGLERRFRIDAADEAAWSASKPCDYIVIHLKPSWGVRWKR